MDSLNDIIRTRFGLYRSGYICIKTGTYFYIKMLFSLHTVNKWFIIYEHFRIIYLCDIVPLAERGGYYGK